MATQIVGPDYQGGGAARAGASDRAAERPTQFAGVGNATIGGEARPGVLTDALSKATEGMGNTVTDIADQQAKTQQDTYMMQQSSQYELAARNVLQEAQRNAQPGMPIKDTVQESLGKLRGQYMKGIESPTLQAQATAHYTRADEEVMANAQAYDFAERDRNSQFNLQQGAQNFGKVLLNSSYDDVDRLTGQYLSQYVHTLDNSSLKPDDYHKMLVEGKEIILDSANEGKIMADPQRYQKENLATTAFAHADAFTARQEGGFLANDSGKGPTNYGINQTAHPEVDVSKLTPEQAQTIRKTYWDKIGGDSLPPPMAMVAYDTAIQSGSAKAKELLQQSGGDTEKYLALRADFLQKWAKETGNQEKIPGMMQRIEQLNEYIKGAGGQDENGDYQGKGSFSYRQATPEQQWSYKSHAYQMMRQQRYDSQIMDGQAKSVINDIERGILNGDNIPAEARANLTTATQGASPAVQEVAAATQRHLDIADGVNKMSLPDAANYATQVHEAAKTPEQIADADYVQKLMKVRQNAVTKDPLGAYGRAGNEVPALDFNDVSSLRKRATIAKTAADLYGITPDKAMLRPEDKVMLSNMLDQSPPSIQLQALKTLHDGINDEQLYHATLSQIRPNNPVVSLAGDYVGLAKSLSYPHFFSPTETVSAYDVANRLLQGDAILNPSKNDQREMGKGKEFPLPPDKQFRQYMPAEYGGLFQNLPQAQSDMLQAVKSYYTALAVQKGNYSGNIDSDLLAKSYRDVLGAASNVNGKGNVLAPWGMSGSDFEDGLAKAYGKQAGKAGIDIEKFPYGSMGFENRGVMGQYRVRNGSGYLVDKKGNPVVIDIGASS